MKKLCILTSLLLCVLLLAGNASAASKFASDDVQTARLAALDLLMITAFEAEYNDQLNNRLAVWQDTLRLFVGGRPTDKDRAALDDFIMTLAVRVPMLPNIRIVDEAKDANVTIYYVPLKDMNDYISGYVDGNWGYGAFWYQNWIRNRAQIAICSDVTKQKQRDHLIMEELVGILGLSQDHYLYDDSILYGEWTETQSLSDIDWLMLNMIYSPYAKPGMTYAQLREVYYPIIMK